MRALHPVDDNPAETEEQRKLRATLEAAYAEERGDVAPPGVAPVDDPCPLGAEQLRRWALGEEHDQYNGDGEDHYVAIAWLYRDNARHAARLLTLASEVNVLSGRLDGACEMLAARLTTVERDMAELHERTLELAKRVEELEKQT